MMSRCRVTKRKPLAWYADDDGHELPDCGTCLDWLLQPGMAEAIHSVGIEHADGAHGVMRRSVERYHANRHRK